MAFKATAAKLYRLVGRISLSDLPSDWQEPTSKSLKNLEEKYPQFAQALIKGSKPHLSSSDPSDNEDVISVTLQNEDGGKVKSVHIHKDGSVKEK